MSKSPRGFGASVTRDRLDFSSSGEWKALFEPTEKGARGISRSESSTKQVHFDMNRSGQPQQVPDHLDLYNFEDPGAEESRYVLTSPRSLEACARFGIKPLELLHKSYEEFLEEFSALYDTNYSHNAVHEVYQEHERQRLRKLKLCREERERIIKETENDQMSFDQERDKIRKHTQQTNPDFREHRMKKDRGQNTAWGDTQEFRESDDQKYERSRSSSPTGQQRLMEIFGETGRSCGRKAENTSLLTRTSSEGSSPVRHRPPSGKSTSSGRKQSHSGIRTYGESSDSEASDTYVVHHRFGARTPRQDSGLGASSAQSSPRVTRRASNASSSSSLARVNKQIKRRSMSMDSLLADMSVPALAGAANMSEKDQRIIDLMLSRHEEEERQKAERRVLDLEWDEQRQLEKDIRQARERNRQLENYTKLQEKELKQHEVRARRLRYEQKLKRDKQARATAKESVWRREKRRQDLTTSNRMEMKKTLDIERKRLQEQNKRLKEEEEEMKRSMTYLSLLDKHEQAAKKRNMRAAREQIKLQVRNETAKSKHANKMENVLQRSKDEDVVRRHHIAEKHQLANQNYQKQLAQRDYEMQLKKLREKEKFERQKEQLRRMQKEMQDWQESVKAYREQTIKKAERVASLNVASKQIKARTQSFVRKQEHSDNFRKVQEEEELRKSEIKSVINIKDKRSDLVTLDKEEVKRLNRQAARSSQAVRDMVREQTTRSSFDRMAEKAHLQARVGSGPRTGHKNQSTVRLG